VRKARLAARVAVLDGEGSIFLLRYDNEEVGIHWAMPGGGAIPGETPLETARRELREETGWSDIEPTTELWTWEHEFTHDGVPVRQFERIFLGLAARREPVGDLTDAHASDGILAWRWWTPAEIDSASEPLWPPELPDLLRNLPNRRAPGRE
jgi:ADP-ribose pyrophosphatase YjhB (NUDIX family)